MRGIRRLALFSLFAAFAISPAAAQAAPGDLYIGDADDDNPQVIRIDPDHPRRQEVVAHGHGLLGPDSGAFTKSGKLLIADYSADGIFRINVKTGAVKPFGGTTGFAGPTDVAVARDGTVYAADPRGHTDNAGAILEATAGEDPALISDGQFFNSGPLGLAVTRSGSILTADQDAGPSDSGALIRVNPESGDQSIVAEGFSASPYGMTLSRDGKSAFLAEQTDGAIVRINIKTGADKVIADNNRISAITDVALGLDGMLYAVNDSTEKPAVVRVNPKNGNTKVIAHDRKLTFPEGITVEPR